MLQVYGAKGLERHVRLVVAPSRGRGWTSDDQGLRHGPRGQSVGAASGQVTEQGRGCPLTAGQFGRFGPRC